MVTPGKVVELHACADGCRIERSVDPGRSAAPQLDVVQERDGEAAVDRRPDLLVVERLGQLERDVDAAIPHEGCDVNRLGGRDERLGRQQEQGTGSGTDQHERIIRGHSLTLSKSLSSVMNSPMSRKCRYTEAKRT